MRRTEDWEVECEFDISDAHIRKDSPRLLRGVRLTATVTDEDGYEVFTRTWEGTYTEVGEEPTFSDGLPTVEKIKSACETHLFHHQQQIEDVLYFWTPWNDPHMVSILERLNGRPFDCNRKTIIRAVGCKVTIDPSRKSRIGWIESD
jgi:hypothetical protein